ncbi:hypothetical protein Bca52824_016346 [Brassica carinata]|uniref:Uncharacterized protein n=1 Tax=Brassica carinata TaxID=52824 RepID=A0A8X7W3F1_BRACI|nr:hypothetical protein Bca52824_016346 [Brassica carinata]
MSSRKGSSKRHSPSHSSSGDSYANEVITRKKSLKLRKSKGSYYKALCGSLPPLQDIPIPKRPVRSSNAPLTPSMVSSDYLTTLRNF